MAQATQASLTLDAAASGQPLVFSATPSGRYFIDIFADCVFEIRFENSGCWIATMRRRGEKQILTRRICSSLISACEYLQAKAVRLAQAGDAQ